MHSEAKKYGFSTKSFGKGEDRAVRVFKTVRKHPNAEEMAYRFNPREETVGRIMGYLERYPPSKEEVSGLVDDCRSPADGGHAMTSSNGKNAKGDGCVIGGKGRHAPKKARLGGRRPRGIQAGFWTEAGGGSLERGGFGSTFAMV